MIQMKFFSHTYQQSKPKLSFLDPSLAHGEKLACLETDLSPSAQTSTSNI